MGLYRILQLEAPSVWSRVQKYAGLVQAAKEQEIKAAAAEKRPLKIYWTDLDAPKVPRLRPLVQRRTLCASG